VCVCLRPLRGGNIPAAIAVAANIAMLFMFGFSQKVKWFLAQQMLSPISAVLNQVD